MKLLIVCIILVIKFEISLCSSLCDVTTETTGDALPNLPEQFQAHIEHNFASESRNYTIEYDEYYDFSNDRGTVFKYFNGKIEKNYYLYNTNEIISITDEECFVNPLNSSLADNPFGLLTINNSLSINSPSYVLKNGYNISYTKYEGKDQARGINVDKWSSCFYIDEIKMTVKATWTWTDKSWETSMQGEQFPVEMSVESLTDSGIHTKELYEYSSYKPRLTADPEIFETPKLVYCKGRKLTKPLPKVPNHFSYRIGLNLVEFNKTTSQSEWYDFDNEIARFDYQPLSEIEDLVAGKDKITEIHDFKAGLRYIIDKKLETCLNITTLDPYEFDSNFVNNTKNSYVRIRTALEMFHFDKVDYQYHGSRKVRGIDCDIWIAKRDDWPPHPDKNTTSYWEWAFMSNKWDAVNSGEPQQNIPIQLTIKKFVLYGSIWVSITTSYDYFDFKNEKPNLFDFEIGQCFDGIRSKHLMMNFKDIDYGMVPDKHAFRYEISKKISNLTNIFPTRVSQVELDFKDGDLVVIFKLLEQVNIKGNSQNQTKPVTLDDAHAILKSKIDSGDFDISLENLHFTAEANSLRDVLGTDASKSDNTAAIIGSIVSGVFGILIGLLGYFAFMKFKNRNSQQSVLSMSGIMNK